MNKTLATLAAFGLLLPSYAQAREIQVEYRDLNLEHPLGQKRLEQRIDSAARKVCDFERNHTRVRAMSAEARACYQKAKAGAARQVAAVVEQQAKGG